MSKTLGNVTARTERAAKLPRAFDTATRRVFTNYTATMTPEADTAETEDGVPGRRRIHLVAADGSMLMIGWAHATEGRAELNTLGHTLSLSKQHLGREIVIKPVEYTRFLEVATQVLNEHGVTGVAVVSVGKSQPPSRRRPSTLPYVASVTPEPTQKVEPAAARRALS